jgi:hypothetical protein
VSRLTLPAAIRMISRPTAVDPVKAIFRTSGWLASRAPTTGRRTVSIPVPFRDVIHDAKPEPARG